MPKGGWVYTTEKNEAVLPSKTNHNPPIVSTTKGVSSAAKLSTVRRIPPTTSQRLARSVRRKHLAPGSKYRESQIEEVAHFIHTLERLRLRSNCPPSV